MTMGFVLGFGGTAAREQVVTVSSILDVDYFSNTSNGASAIRMAKVANDVYALYFSASTLGFTVFSIGSDGQIGSISRNSSVLSGKTFTALDHGLCYIDDNVQCVTYADSSVEKVAIITYSGVTPTLGTPQTLTSASAPFRLSATSVLLLRADGDTQIGTISGSSISLSSVFDVTGFAPTGVRPGCWVGDAYDSTHIVLASPTGGLSVNGFAGHFTITPGTPTAVLDSSVTLFADPPDSSYPLAMGVISTSRWVFSGKQGIRVVDRSGSVISLPSTELTQPNPGADNSALAVIGSTQVLSVTNANADIADATTYKIDISVAGLPTDAGLDMSFDQGVVGSPVMTRSNNGFYVMAYQGTPYASSVYFNKLVVFNVEG